MKKSLTFFADLVLLFLSLTVFFGCSAAKNISTEQVTNSDSLQSMINAHNFVFVPQFVNPVGISRRDVSGGNYDFTVKKDTVISYLPFFGRGYIAPLSPTDVDFDFTSTKFSYTILPAKHGWNISIKPADQHYLHEFYFKVFNNGSASLTITSIDRSSLSYDGYIAVKQILSNRKK